jgi:hypothetical protein
MTSTQTGSDEVEYPRRDGLSLFVQAWHVAARELPGLNGNVTKLTLAVTSRHKTDRNLRYATASELSSLAFHDA